MEEIDFRKVVDSIEGIFFRLFRIFEFLFSLLEML